MPVVVERGVDSYLKQHLVLPTRNQPDRAQANPLAEPAEPFVRRVRFVSVAATGKPASGTRKDTTMLCLRANYSSSGLFGDEKRKDNDRRQWCSHYTGQQVTRCT